MRLFALLISILILAALPLRAQDWQTALSASSPRLQLFALMMARPDGAAELVANLQKSQGFAHQRGAGVQYVHHALTFAPYLSYDNNINGGTPGQTILIGGLPFQIAPASQAKQGLLAGLTSSADLRLSLSPHTVISANQSFLLARAVDYDLSVAAVQTDLCLGQFLGAADWLDLCIGQSKTERALFRSATPYISLGLTKQFASPLGFHEASGKLQRRLTADYRQLNLEMGLTTARATLGVLETRFDFGQHIVGQHTRLFGASVALRRPLLEQNTTFFASYAKEGGARFFGDPRDDEVYGLGISRPILGGLAVTLSLRNRKSTLANYDGVTFGVDFNFSKVTF